MTNRPLHSDELGKLCHDGLDIARFLHEVPDDAGERDRLKAILDKIGADPSVRARTEFPKIVAEMREAIKQLPDPLAPDLLQNGFDRMVRLWSAAKSGMY